MNTSQLPPNVLPVPRWTIAIHGVQMLFAIIILGFDAYGIKYIAYYALIFSLVVCLLTLLICAYIVGTSLFIHKVYNRFIVLGAHILMAILWLVDLGVVANLARIWANPNCYYSYVYGGYRCFYGRKRGLESHALAKREDTTTINTYHNVLIVGALFGAIQLVLWVFSAVIFFQHLNKHNANSTHNPPVFTGGNNDQAVPMEQTIGQTAPMQPQSVYPPAQQYPVGMSPQPQYSSPMAQPQGEYQHQQTQYLGSPYGHDPVTRTHTVSPVSQANTYVPPHNASELGTQQHIGGYNPNVSELSVQK